jgi:uncharacterized protein (DUF1015 family)
LLLYPPLDKILVFRAHLEPPFIMAEIFPFQAYRYNTARVQPSDVLTQPYDKISPQMQQAYYRRSPYNLIPVEKGTPQPADSASNNVYTRAEKTLEQWIGEKIVVQDPKPGIYVYSQEYTVPGLSERRTRTGFIALGRVEDYSAGVVFRHEYTLSGPKADRLELLRHTHTHTGQLFMLYTDPQRQADTLLQAAISGSPFESCDEYGVIHRLWPVFDTKVIAAVKKAMSGQKLVIADGHHRYETAVAYRDERRAADGRRNPDAPYEKVMMSFFNTRTEGLLVLPTHRVVSALPNFNAHLLRTQMAPIFETRAFPFSSSGERIAVFDDFREEMDSAGPDTPVIGMYAGGEFVIFRLRPQAKLAELLPDVPPAVRLLDVVLLHEILLNKGLGITLAAATAGQHLTYFRDMSKALAAVDEGKAQAAFLLNPIGVERVSQIALSGQVLPQKSTDFYPKLLSGMTLYRME